MGCMSANVLPSNIPNSPPTATAFCIFTFIQKNYNSSPKLNTRTRNWCVLAFGSRKNGKVSAVRGREADLRAWMVSCESICCLVVESLETFNFVGLQGIGSFGWCGF